MERDYRDTSRRGRWALGKINSILQVLAVTLLLKLFTVFCPRSYVLNICCATGGVSHEKWPGCWPGCYSFHIGKAGFPTSR